MGDTDARESLMRTDGDIEYVVAAKGTKAVCLQRILTYRAMAGHVDVGGAYRQREGASMTWGSVLMSHFAFFVGWGWRCCRRAVLGWRCGRQAVLGWRFYVLRVFWGRFGIRLGLVRYSVRGCLRSINLGNCGGNT